MNKQASNFLIGLLSGAAIGAALGILFAPDKGANTRKKIGDKAKSLKHDLEEKFEDLKDYVNESVNKAKGENPDEKQSI